MILRPNGELSCMNVYINDLTKGEKVISLNVKNIYIFCLMKVTVDSVFL